MTSVSPTPDDVLLKRYEKEIDLYKFYFEIAVKGSLFAFGVTGALLSYFFSKPEDPCGLGSRSSHNVELWLSCPFLGQHQGIKENELRSRTNV